MLKTKMENKMLRPEVENKKEDDKVPSYIDGGIVHFSMSGCQEDSPVKDVEAEKETKKDGV